MLSASSGTTTSSRWIAVFGSISLDSVKIGRDELIGATIERFCVEHMGRHRIRSPRARVQLFAADGQEMITTRDPGECTGGEPAAGSMHEHCLSCGVPALSIIIA